MTLATLFTMYLVLVAGAVGVVAFVTLGRHAAWLSVTAVALWLAYATVIGATCIAGHIDTMPLGIAWLAGPVVLTVVLTMLSRPGTLLARHLPLALLLGFQLFRLGVELTLNQLAHIGLAPRLMTLEGGNIEILVAVTAPVAAWLVSRGTVGWRLAWAWNLVGLLSLANIVARAVLSAPGPFQLIHAEVPDVAILTYPFTFIPGFMAPLGLALHMLAFRAFHQNRVRAR